MRLDMQGEEGVGSTEVKQSTYRDDMSRDPSLNIVLGNSIELLLCDYCRVCLGVLMSA